MGAGSQELTDRAKLLISERRFQEAVRACRRALLSKPDQVEIRLLLAEALLALERYDEVRVEMMALARKAPEEAAVYRLLGEAYLRDHRPHQAVEALQKALELDPSDEVAQELLSEAADEPVAVSTTIERWFAEEAEPTVETGSPSGWEESTEPPRAATAPMHGHVPSVEIDPALTEKLPLLDEPRTSPSHVTPEARARKAPPPPPPSLGLPLDVAPPRAARPLGPGAPSPFAPPPLDELAPPGAGPFEADDETGPAKPSAMRALEPIEPLDDFELLASDEIEPLENEPTRALIHDEPEPPRIADLDEDFDEVPTHAIDLGALPGAPTRTRPPPGAPTSEPPTQAHVSPPALEERPSVPSVQYETPSLPNAAIEAAPEPPLPRRGGIPAILPLAIGGIVLLGLLVGVGFGVSRFLAASDLDALREAAAAAGDSGAAGELEAVVQQIGASEDPQLQALQLRLLATLTLEHGQDHAAAIAALESRLAEEPGLNDVRIGSALLALAEEDPGRALDRLYGLEVENDQIPEAFRARALALAARGSYALAAEAAQRAFEVRPRSPRHLALHALMQHRVDHTANARTLLENFDGRATQPTIRLTLARVLLESGADPQRAAEEASAVIDELGVVASPYELAWAHLIKAHTAAENGDVATAETQARAAAERRPPSDEPFVMRLAQTFLLAGLPEQADEQLGHLPEPEIDAPGRALLNAEVALARDDLDRADRAIRGAGDGVRQNLLRARILEERGETARAVPLYRAAMNDAGPEGRRARVRLAAIELAAGNPRQTIAYLEDHQAEAVDDPELIPILARAYLAEGRLDDARPILDAALSQRPTSPDLLATQGELLLAAGQPQDALEPLRRAAQARATDPAIQVHLGRAALLAGESDEARAAFEAALARDDDNADALLGLARLAFASRDDEQLEARLTAAQASGADAAEVARLRARSLVRRGEGEAGIEALTALTRQHGDDAALWTALGQLQVQAESDRDARRSLERALRLDPGRPEALLTLSLVEMRDGGLGRARDMVTTAVSQAEQRGESTPALQAWAAVARGRVAFEAGDWAAVTRLANEAIELDANASGAHMLLAIMAIEGHGGTEPVEELRRAVDGDAPAPEAVAQLALRLASSDRAEACRLARRYLAVAPDGYDASEVRRLAGRCR